MPQGLKKYPLFHDQVFLGSVGETLGRPSLATRCCRGAGNYGPSSSSVRYRNNNNNINNNEQQCYCESLAKAIILITRVIRVIRIVVVTVILIVIAITTIT